MRGPLPTSTVARGSVSAAPFWKKSAQAFRGDGTAARVVAPTLGYGARAMASDASDATEADALTDSERTLRLLDARGVTIGRPLTWLGVTGSTNDDAKRGAREGAPHGATWVADAQANGRGRQGRAWLSAPGENLLFSVLLRVPCLPARVPPLALVAGLAVRDAVAACVPHRQVGLKWPNDVLVDGRKIAGVLVEASVQGGKVGSVVVGVGVNVGTRSFPADIAARATSIALISADGVGAIPPSRAELLVSILARLSETVPLAAARGLAPLLSRLDAVCVLRGHRVRSETAEGTALRIDEDGRLVVRRVDGAVERWAAGEVHLSAVEGPP
jgi:BirA family biotin operon repressor/biotin-[acetyl-CoA-carboxylase] ligase